MRIFAGSITIRIIVAAFLGSVLMACNATRMIPEERDLLKGYTIQCDNKTIDIEELDSYVKQRPNKTLFGIRLYTFIYNYSVRKETNFRERIGQRMGEKPVIYSELLTNKTMGQFKLYLQNKGYYHATIEDTIRKTGKRKYYDEDGKSSGKKKRMVSLTYIIKTGEPYVIRSIRDTIEDPDIQTIYNEMRKGAIVRKGHLFDVGQLENERTRLTDTIRSRGYYKFQKQYIYYLADTTLSGNAVDLILGIKNPIFESDVPPTDTLVDWGHKVYLIDSVCFHADYDIRKEAEPTTSYLADSLSLSKVRVEFPLANKRGKPGLKTETLLQGLYILPDSLYNSSHVAQSNRYYGSLRAVKLVNISFHEPDFSLYEDTLPLNAHIYITPAVKQSFTIEIEGTNTSGNFGVAGNIAYQHLNVFRGSEHFGLKLTGAREAQFDVIGGGATSFNTNELGVETSLETPKFLVPFLRSENFRRKYAPKTKVLVAFNYQKRQDYTRFIQNVSAGYYWKTGDYITHYLNPVNFNLVRLPYKSARFDSIIAGLYIKDSYTDHAISASNYSLIYNNQNINKRRDHTYSKLFVEVAGNSLYGFNTLFNSPETEDGNYTVFNTRYAQYFKTDWDFRFYDIHDQRSSMVYRFFVGAGFPYGNLKVMPFSKKYFAGGANSLRAWAVRSLGPGSYVGDTAQVGTVLPNQLGDIILEANMEYRFKMFWMFEGALFLDAGNIWAINKDDNREGALFAWDTFYREIALGTGVGLRLDLSFFVFRLDMGLKLRDPSLPAGERWVLGQKDYRGDRIALNLGIGYPF